MGAKRKGIDAERELVHLFWGVGWPAVRVAGSGSMRHPCPDILAFGDGRILAIECKVGKGTKKYVGNEEISALKEFAGKMGAEVLVGIKFNKTGWFFLSPEDMLKTGKHHVASLGLAEKKGVEFKKLTCGSPPFF